MIEVTTYAHNGAEIDTAEAEDADAALVAAKQLTLDAIAAGEQRPIKAVFRVDGRYVAHVWRAEIDGAFDYATIDGFLAGTAGRAA